MAARKHYTDVIGTLGAGGLTNVATTHTFTSLTYVNGTAVPTLTGSDSFLLSILDASGNVLEVVLVTAWDSGTKAATIVRAREGTTAIAHAGSLNVANAVYPSDLTYIGVKAYRSSAYSLVNTTVTHLPWNAELWDTDGFHDNSTNPERFTVPAGLAGLYRATANLGVDVTGATYARFFLNICVNGTAARGGNIEMSASATSFPMALVTTELDLAVGDYVTLAYYQDSAATRNMYLSLCAMSMHKIG